MRFPTTLKKDFTVVDGKILWTFNKIDLLWYTKTVGNESQLEYEIVLKSKPSTNKVTLEVDTTNVDWHYQPALNTLGLVGQRGITAVTETTATDKDGNIVSYRPPEVVGSYALYKTNRKTVYNNHADADKYKIGKVAHFYRPFLKDALGNTSWANMTLNAGLLTIECDQTFLNAATYPVVIDPTFGYTSAGTSTDYNWKADVAVGSTATSPSDASSGTSWTIKSYCAMKDSGTGNMKGVIYLVASPYGLVTNGVGGESDQITTTAGWKTSTYSTAPTVANSTSYHVWSVYGNFSGGTDVLSYYDSVSGTGTGSYQNGIGYASPNSVANNFNNLSNANVSTYASYSAGSNTYECSATDGFKHGETLAPQRNLYVACTDGLKGAEAHGFTWPKSASDGMTLAEVIGTVFNSSPVLTDGFKIGDSPATNVNIIVIATDGVTLADARSAQLVTTITLTDGITGADVASIEVTTAGVYNLLATDGLVGADSTSAQLTISITNTDGVKLSELLAAVRNAQVLATDGVKLSDTPNIYNTLTLTLTDGAKIAETLAVFATINKTLTDGVTVSDAPSTILYTSPAITDGVKMSDLITTLIAYTIAVGDGIKVSDTAEYSYIIPRILSIVSKLATLLKITNDVTTEDKLGY